MTSATIATVEAPRRGVSTSRGEAPVALSAAGERPMMSRSSRLMVALAALALLVTYVAPLWHIGLKAPQYPEGLGMYIWSSQITGEKPQDLRSINGLNHYIGMQAIEPDAIRELRFMPLLLAGLVATGLLVALIGRRWALAAWVGAFVLLALAGLADFWKWGYDFGHNLDPTAAIKVPGLTYQPPLLGTKQLLNFRATSWPALGGWVAIGSLVAAVAVLFLERRSVRGGGARATG